MKILIYLHHPAQYHLFKNIINKFGNDGHEVVVFATKKDILTDLLDKSGIKYINNLPDGRKNNMLSMAMSVLKQDVGLFSHCFRNRPELMMGTSAEICHVGKILNIPSIFFNEDDYEAVPLAGCISYPFADYIVAPYNCSTGKWEKKTIRHNSLHELAYLHPNNFKPDFNVVKKYFNPNQKYFIIRFSSLSAHHDNGIMGLRPDLVLRIIEVLNKKGKIIINRENGVKLPYLSDNFIIDIDPNDMHHVMAFSDMLISDSQTMSAEAGVLGIPFIRCNDFVGRISYLQELENIYKLGYGVKSNDSDKIIPLISSILNSNYKGEWSQRKRKLLGEKEDMVKVINQIVDKIMMDKYEKN